MSEHVKNCQITTAMCHLSHLSHLSIRHVVLQALVVSRTHVQDLLGGMPGCTKLQKQNTICFCLYTYTYINYISVYLCLSLSSKRFFSALKTPLETAESFLENLRAEKLSTMSACALLALLNLRQSHVPGTVSSSGHGMCERSPLRSHSSGSSRSLS